MGWVWTWTTPGLNGTLTLIFAISETIKGRYQKAHVKVLKYLEKLYQIPRFKEPYSKIKFTIYLFAFRTAFTHSILELQKILKDQNN